MVQWDKTIGNIIWEITRHTYPNMIMVYNIGILILWDTFLFFNSVRWKPLHVFFLVNIVLFHSYDKSPRGTWKRKVKNKRRWLTHSNHHSITTVIIIITEDSGWNYLVSKHTCSTGFLNALDLQIFQSSTLMNILHNQISIPCQT